MIHTAKDYKCGYQVQLVFDLAQEEGEREVLTKIGRQYWDNEYKWAKSATTEHLRITKLSSIVNHVDPFFTVNKLQSRKRHDFIIWQEMLGIILRKEHTCLEGVNRIRDLVLLQKQFREGKKK